VNLNLRLSVALVLCALAALAATLPAGGQVSDVLTVLEPAGEILLPDTDAEGHVTVQLNTVAPGLPSDAGVTLAATIDGQMAPQPSLREVRPGSAVYELRYPVAPCALPSANDLPGAEIALAFQVRVYDRPLQADGSPMPDATLIGGELVNRVLTLGADTVAPTLEFEPAGGATARPGASVALSYGTTDVNQAGSWASGIKEVVVVDGDGGEVGRADDPNGEPLPCERKQQAMAGRGAYTVPADAREGDVIALTATATDWAGNTTVRTLQVRVSDREEWEGEFSFRIEAIDGSSGAVMFGTVVAGQFSFELDRSLDPSGASAVVKGTGRATRMTYGGRSGDCTVQFSHTPESITLEVGGALLMGSFLLVLADPAPSTMTITTTCGGVSDSGTVPSIGAAVHPFGVEVAAMDDAEFMAPAEVGGLRTSGRLTVRRRTGAGTTP
jgi:hypothetical protein